MAEKPCNLLKNGGGMDEDIRFKLVESGSFTSTNGNVTVNTSSTLGLPLILVRLDDANANTDIYSFALGRASASYFAGTGIQNVGTHSFMFNWDSVHSWKYYIYTLW